MTNLRTLVLKSKLSRRELDYQGSLRSAARGLWSGEEGIFFFLDNATLAIERSFTAAWAEGLGECGISLSEQTPEEEARLRAEINLEIGYIAQFAWDINRNTKYSGGKLNEIFKRIEMWVNKYGMIRALARTYACGDEKLEWVMNPFKEHCRDCLRLNGKVYRRSVWRAQGIYPRMPSLECGGYRCGCDLVQTTLPLSRGRPIGGF